MPFLCSSGPPLPYPRGLSRLILVALSVYGPLAARGAVPIGQADQNGRSQAVKLSHYTD